MSTLTTDRWIGANGAFTLTADWSAGSLPGATNDAYFGETFPYLVTFATTATLGGLDDWTNALATLDLASGALTVESGAWGGAFVLASGATLDVPGPYLLAGLSTLEGAITGGGAVSVSGAAEATGLALSGNTRLVVSGTLAAEGAVTVGASSSDASSLLVTSGGSLILADPSTLFIEGTGSLANSGLLDVAAGGTSDLAGNVLLGGTVTLDENTLGLYGGSSSLAGAVAGPGTLALFGGGTFDLTSSATLGMSLLELLSSQSTLLLNASPTLTAAATFGPGTTLDLEGHTLTLAGVASLGGVVNGGGTLITTGTAIENGLIGSSLDLSDQGTLLVTGSLSLDAASTLAVPTAASLILDPGAAIAAGGYVAAGGLIRVDAGDGTDYLSGAPFVSVGTLAINPEGSLALSGAASLEGPLQGGTLVLQGGGTFTLGPGLTLNVAALDLAGTNTRATLATSLASPTAFVLGANTALILNNHAATLSGAASLAGTLAGPGTLTLAGSIDSLGQATLTGGATLALATGAAALSGPLTLGTSSADGAALTLAAGASLLLGDGAGLLENGGTLSNAGLVRVATGSTVSLTGGMTNTGTLSVSAGTLALASLANAGQVAVSGGEISVSGALSGSGGTLALSGGGEAVLGGASAGAVIAFSGAGTLDLPSPANFTGTISGFGAGDVIDLGGLTANAAAYASGTLTLEETASGGTSVVGALAFSGLANPGALALAADGAGGTEILYAPPTPVFQAIAPPSGTVDWVWASSSWSPSTPGASSLAIVGNNGTQAAVWPALNGTIALLQGGSLVTLGQGSGTLAIEENLIWPGSVNVGGGLLDLMSGGTIGGGLSLAAGASLDIGADTLRAAGATLSGALAGAGTLAVGGTATLAPGLSLGEAGLVLGNTTTLAANLSYGGTLDAPLSTTLVLGGNSLGLSGAATLEGLLTGPGTVTASGVALLEGATLANGASFLDQGTVYAEALLLQGGTSASTSLSIASGGDLLLLGAQSIAGSGAATLSLAGTLEKLSPGTSTLAPAFLDQGTLRLDHGTLDLTGAASLTGAVSGPGTLAIAGTATLGTLTLAAPLAVLAGATASLSTSLSDPAPVRLAAGGTLTLANGATLGLTGPATLDGTIVDPATMSLAGTAIADGLGVSGSGTIAVSGTLIQEGNITLGLGTADTPTLSIAAGGTYEVNADANLNSLGNPNLVNAGLIEKTAGTGLTYLFANLQSSGTIAVAQGTLALAAGAASLGGAVSGAGTLDLTSGSATLPAGTAESLYTFLPGLSLSVAAIGVLGDAELIDAAGGTYGGSFLLSQGTLNPDGSSLTITGPASLAGTLAGAGTLDLPGTAVAAGFAVLGSATALVSGDMVLEGGLSVGGASSTGVFEIAASGTLALTDEVPIDVFAGGALINQGVLSKEAGIGTATLMGELSNQGTIAAAAGTFSIAGALSNGGTLLAQGGTLVLGGSLTAPSGGQGLGEIGATGAVIVQSAVASSQSFAFTAGSGSLVIDAPGQFFGSVRGFAAGDVIDFPGITFSAGETLAYASGTLALTNAGTPEAALALSGSFNPGSLELAADATGGTEVTIDPPPCFAEGTPIDTPAGPVAVENLRVGDVVSLASGGFAPIVWIGAREVDIAGHAAPDAHWPVRIRAHAFGPGKPRCDILLSPDHAVWAGGVLVPVKFLVNGRSIRVEKWARIRYLHFALPRHGLALGAGLPVETFIDAEAARTGLAHRCAPLCLGGAALARLRARLGRRALRLYGKEEGGSTAIPVSPAASTSRRSARARAMQPTVGAKSGAAGWRKIAEPRPGTGRTSFQPSTPITS